MKYNWIKERDFRKLGLKSPFDFAYSIERLRKINVCTETYEVEAHNIESDLEFINALLDEYNFKFTP